MKPAARALLVLLAVVVGLGSMVGLVLVVPTAAMLGCIVTSSCVPVIGPGISETPVEWKPSPLDGLPADEVLRRARATVHDARWGEVELLGNRAGDDVDYVRLTVDEAGNRELYASVKDRSVWLRVVDGVVYVSGNYPTSGRLVPIPEDRWVRARPGDDPRAELSRVTDGLVAWSLQDLVSGLLDDRGRPVSITGRESTRAGQQVFLRIGEGSGAVEVAVEAEGRPGPLAIHPATGTSLQRGAWENPPRRVEAPGRRSLVEDLPVG